MAIVHASVGRLVRVPSVSRVWFSPRGFANEGFEVFVEADQSLQLAWLGSLVVRSERDPDVVLTVHPIGEDHVSDSSEARWRAEAWANSSEIQQRRESLVRRGLAIILGVTPSEVQGYVVEP